MNPTPPRPRLRRSLTPELRSTAIEQTESRLLEIVRANLNTQYVSKTASLTGFRDAISTRGFSSDTVLVQDFRRCVPLSDYESYRPFMAVFDKHPCKEAEIENLFAPGLPFFLAVSSATSGKGPKLFPLYYSAPPSSTFLDPKGPAAVLLFFGYREVKEVEGAPGQIVKKIPVSIGSAGVIRDMLGWTNIDGDDNRMSLMVPGLVAPWAASMITHHKTFLMVHALFMLACRDLDCISTTFSTLFYDLLRNIEEGWVMFLSSIKDGTVPDLPGIHEVRSHLQAHMHANPNRAVELREIGPPLSREGWAACAWPKLRVITFACSATFATVLPKVKSVIGPTIAIRAPGYGATESFIAVPHQPDILDTFVLRCKDFIEFLDITSEESHKNLRQAWELEVGKQYDVVLTTHNGLWRYQLGDVIRVVGFDADDGSPVFVFCGRRNLAVRLSRISISDTQLSLALKAVSSDVMQVHEFTTVLDDRQSTSTVGYFVEPAGMLGPNAYLAPLQLTEGLVGAHAEFQRQLDEARIRPPTVRIVRSGTFAEYRQWRGEKMNTGPGQVKVPAVLLDTASTEWVLERVVREL